MTTKAVAGIKAHYSEDDSTIFWIVDGHYPTGDNENELVVMDVDEVKQLERVSDFDIPEEGRYEHFKRNYPYTVKGIVKNPETDDVFVWYQSEYSRGIFKRGTNWVRPVQMFLDEKDLPDYKGPRFKKLPI